VVRKVRASVSCLPINSTVSAAQWLTEANVESVYELDSLALEKLPRRLVRETDAAFGVRLAEVNGQHWWVHCSEAYSQQSGRASSLVLRCFREY
jgi:hypothetical protein